MAGTLGRSDRDLNEALAREPSAFGFFQAIRLLSLAQSRSGGALPPALRFRTELSLAFPASELVAYRPDATAGEAGGECGHDELTVSFMGLTGPSGVLPVAYTELLIERRMQRDAAAHTFLDLFNHRALTLFHAAWRKYRHWLDVESGAGDGLGSHLLDLCGLGTLSLRAASSDGAALDRRVLLRYAGLLAQKPLSAHALETVMRGVLKVPVSLQSFVGQWMALPESECTRLGLQGCSVDGEALAGDRVWDRQGRMTLRVGPVRRARFDSLLPDGGTAAMLRELLRFAFGHGLGCDMVVVFDRRDLPAAQLDAEAAPILGGNLWCDGAALAHDPDDLRYALLR